jgi:hypothetical protein
MLECFSMAASGGLVMHSSVDLMAEGRKHIGTGGRVIGVVIEES